MVVLILVFSAAFGVAMLSFGAQPQPEWLRLMLLGTEKLTQNASDDAIKYLTQALDENPPADRKWYIYNYRGIAHGMKDEKDLAFKDFDEALKLSPPPAQAAKIYFMRGALYDRFCRADLGLTEVDKGLALDRQSSEGFAARAVIELSHFGNYPRVIKDLDEAVRLANLETAEKGAAARSYALWKRAEARLALEQCSLAQSDVEIALRYAPQAEAYCGRARIELANGDYAAAISDCERALQLNAKHLDSHRVQGEALLCEGKVEEARKAFSEGKDVYNAALLDFSQHNTQAAIFSLKQNLPATNCESREIVRMYGMLLYALGQPDDAYYYLRRSVDESGTPAFYWSVMLLSAKGTHNAEEGTALIKAKLAGFPQDIWPIQLMKLASDEQSLDDTLTSIQGEKEVILNQRKGEAHYVAGELALLHGDTKSAQIHFRQAISKCRRSTVAQVLASQQLSPIK